MKKFIILITLILTMINTLKAEDFPKIKGWKPVSEVSTYSPENLYEYIDGAADQFLDYGFQNLTSQDLAKGDLTATVDIYDMGSRINAFGIYKTERPASDKGIKVGAEGIISPPYQCLLLKGSYYVKVNAFEGEITEANGKDLLESLAAAISGEVEFPPVLKLLPAKFKNPGSERYTRIGFLGLTELNHCIHADYTNQNNKKFQYFIMLPKGDETTESTWEKLAKKWKKSDHKKFSLLVKKVPYKGLNAVALMGDKIIGVTDCENEQQAIQRLEPVVAK